MANIAICRSKRRMPELLLDHVKRMTFMCQLKRSRVLSNCRFASSLDGSTASSFFSQTDGSHSPLQNSTPTPHPSSIGSLDVSPVRAEFRIDDAALTRHGFNGAATFQSRKKKQKRRQPAS